MTQEQRKLQGIEAMKILDIYKPYIDTLEKDNTRTMFIGGAGYFIDEDTEDNLLREMQKIEREHEVYVYTVVKNQIDYDTVYAMLCIGKEPSAEDYDLPHKTQTGDWFTCFAYCYNTTSDWNSEFGYVGVAPLYGGIRRIY